MLALLWHVHLSTPHKKNEYALRLHMSQKAFLFVLSSVTLIILSFFLEPSTYLLVQQAWVLVAESWIHWSLRELQACYGFFKLIPQHCWTSYELLPAANKLSQADGKAVPSLSLPWLCLWSLVFTLHRLTHLSVALKAHSNKISGVLIPLRVSRKLPADFISGGTIIVLSPYWIQCCNLIN